MEELEYFRSYMKRSFFKVNSIRDEVVLQDILTTIIIMSIKKELKFIKKGYVLTQDVIDYAKEIKKEFNNNLYEFKSLFKNLLGDCNLPEFIRYNYTDIESYNTDYIGFVHQFILSLYAKSYMQNQGVYYTSTETLSDIIKEQFMDETSSIYDPFCGAGRISFNKCYNKVECEGSDLDSTAVDIANLNHWLITDTIINPFSVLDFNNVKEQEFIMTNIPFGSLKQNCIMLNKIDNITKYKAVVIVPSGTFERGVEKGYLNDNILQHKWEFLQEISNDEFKPFTKINTEALVLNKINN